MGKFCYTALHICIDDMPILEQKNLEKRLNANAAGTPRFLWHKILYVIRNKIVGK